MLYTCCMTTFDRSSIPSRYSGTSATKVITEFAQNKKRNKLSILLLSSSVWLPRLRIFFFSSPSSCQCRINELNWKEKKFVFSPRSFQQFYCLNGGVCQNSVGTIAAHDTHMAIRQRYGTVYAVEFGKPDSLVYTSSLSPVCKAPDSTGKLTESISVTADGRRARHRK